MWRAGGGCGEQEVGVASGSGWNLWVWLLGVVVRRYIDFLILPIPTPLVYTVFPRIDHARTIYFSALIDARTNRGRRLIEGAVYYCD